MSFKKVLLLSISVFFFCGSFSDVMAQKRKNEDKKMWEESTARQITPEVRMFVTPQICDMKMLSSSRQVFGPYPMDVRMFFAKNFTDVVNSRDLSENMKTNALYLASKESDADAILEPIFHSWVDENNEQIIYLEVSGFPVSYYNFRPATQADLHMVEIVYPSLPALSAEGEKINGKKLLK